MASPCRKGEGQLIFLGPRHGIAGGQQETGARGSPVAGPLQVGRGWHLWKRLKRAGPGARSRAGRGMQTVLRPAAPLHVGAHSRLAVGRRQLPLAPLAGRGLRWRHSRQLRVRMRLPAPRAATAHLDVDLVAQHRRAQDHGLGAPLELLAHEQGLLEGGAALVHVPGVQDLWGGGSAGHCGAQPSWRSHPGPSPATLLWESIRALMSPSRMSCVSSSSSAATVVLKAVAILRMSADT